MPICHKCDKDLSGVDVFYHYDRNHGVDACDIPVSVLVRALKDEYGTPGNPTGGEMMDECAGCGARIRRSSRGRGGKGGILIMERETQAMDCRNCGAYTKDESTWSIPDEPGTRVCPMCGSDECYMREVQEG